MNKEEISPFRVLLRQFGEFVTRPIFSSRISDYHNFSFKIEKNVKNGRGLVIIFTHFGYRDPFELVRTVICTNPSLRTKQVVSPISFHQNNIVIDRLTSLFGVNLFSVVNQDTLEKKGFENKIKGEGLSQFGNKAFHAISNGQIVILAVNAGRREFLDIDDPQRPIGYITASLLGKKCKDFDILLVSISLKGTKSYAKNKVGGLNIGKTYEFKFVDYLSIENLMQKTSGKFSEIDKYVRLLLKKEVPKEYLQK